MAKIQKYTTKKGDRFRFRFYCGIDQITGKEIYKKVSGFQSYKEAKTVMNRLETQRDAGKFKERQRVATIAELYRDWIELYKTTVRPSTYYKQRRKLEKYIVASLGNYRADKLRLIDAQRAVNEWREQTPSETRKNLNFLHRILEYGRKNGYKVNDPTRDVITPKKPEKRLKDNFYNREQLRAFLDALETEKNVPRWQALYKLLAFTGARIGEVLALTWQDFNATESTLTINKTLSGTAIAETKTKSGRRLVTLDAQTVSMLKEWKATQTRQFFALGIPDKANGYIFTQTNGERLKNASPANHWLKKFIKRHDLPKITPHGFRHTHATLLLDGGANIKAVSERLGHSSADITLKIYAHATEHAKRKAAQIFADVVNK